MTLPRLIRRVLQSAFVLYWLSVLDWMATVVTLPRFLGSGVPSPRSVQDQLLRSGIHVVEYGISVIPLHRALKPRPLWKPLSRNPGQAGVGWKPYLLAFLIATGYAIFDEAQQSFIPNRQPSLLDFMADSLGSLLVLGGTFKVQPANSQRSTPIPQFREPLLKRTFDLLLASLGLLLSAPIWLVIALGIKLEDGGPVLHSEERWGRGATVFRIHKFRTTVVSPVSAAPIEADLGDRRFTRVGKFLRARGIDELPQLLNILKGEMSFVGPRPLAVEDVTLQHKQKYMADPRMTGFRERLSVRPGLTGTAQVYGSRHLSHRNKFRYDLLYVRNQSFLLDLRLLALSLWVSMRGKWETKEKKL